MTCRQPPLVRNAVQIRELELELRNLERTRHEAERRIRREERLNSPRHPALRARAAPTLSPGLVVRELPAALDEAALYSLFMKHGQSLSQAKTAFRSAERVAEEDASDSVHGTVQ